MPGAYCGIIETGFRASANAAGSGVIVARAGDLLREAQLALGNLICGGPHVIKGSIYRIKGTFHGSGTKTAVSFHEIGIGGVKVVYPYFVSENVGCKQVNVASLPPANRANKVSGFQTG